MKVLSLQSSTFKNETISWNTNASLKAQKGQRTWIGIIVSLETQRVAAEVRQLWVECKHSKNNLAFAFVPNLQAL